MSGGTRLRWKVALLLPLFAFCAPASAQFAVIDVAAITQLINQLRMLEAQLTQAQAEFAAITGGRGMEGLLAGTVRNYLPPNWAELQQVMLGVSGGYGALAGELQGLIDHNAVLTPDQVAALGPEERDQLEASRRSAALLQTLTREALASTSARFDALQTLIDAIGGAVDQKAILDLQGRVQSEQVMLQNEQSKLQTLYQVAQAEEWSRRQRAREQAIVGVGSLRDLPPLGLNVQ